LTPESAETVNSPKYSTIAGILIDAIRKGHFSQVTEREVPPMIAATPTSGAQSAAYHDRNVPPIAAAAATAATQADNTYQAIEEEQYAAEQAAAAAAAAQEEEQEELPEEDQYEEGFTMNDRRRKPGFFGKLKGMFGNMFEEVDDEEF
ncbi:MAG: hypothetical protein RR465_04230, partial [Mucinivorans sp.]